MIYTTFRKIGVEDMEWSLEDCLQLKKEFPEEIAGMVSVLLKSSRLFIRAEVIFCNFIFAPT